MAGSGKQDRFMDGEERHRINTGVKNFALARRRWLLSLACLVGFGLGLAGCGGTASGPSAETTLSGADLEQAERLYSQLKREHSVQRDRKALDLAGSLLDYYPNFDRNDEVLTLAIDAAARLGDTEHALGLTDELLTRYPQSPVVDQALMRGAELAAAGGDTMAAAGYLISSFDRDPVRGTLSDGRPRAAAHLESLSHTQLGQLMEQHAGSPLWPYIGYLQVRAQLAEGLTVEAADVAARLERQAPQDRWTVAALEIVGAGGRPGRRLLVPMGEVNPYQVGVLAPLSGRYAVLGNAFSEAAILATNQINQEWGTGFELLLRDTGADPVTSALAAREFCVEAGSIAVLGGLLSAPTASAAVTCDGYGVPLISPTATNDNIWKLGPTVFQTNITGLYEVRLLAELATSVMLKQRFAIIYPDTPEGQRHAQIFTSEVEARGGKIVASESFPAQGADFKDTILAVRKKRPEVIFAPATVDQMILLGPQLDFYRAGSLVLGLSNWNSSKLRDHSGTVLERAIFPDDLVLFPAEWEADFHRNWNDQVYPPEATAQALKAYQATRKLLETMAESGATSRRQLADALTRRLSHQESARPGPDSFGATMRMFRDEKIVTFPAGLFQASWSEIKAAAADSLNGVPDAAPAEITP